MRRQVPLVALRDGHLMPQLGLGMWQLAPAECPAALAAALAAGYRGFDTAPSFGNETALGDALQQAGIPRENLFIASKLPNSAHGRRATLRAFDETMRRLRLDQLDLFVIHWPLPAQNLYVESWQALAELQQQGHVRSIGVANFGRDEIARLIGETGVTPAVNQIELHPLFQQRELRGFHARRFIRIQSTAPLGPGTGNAAWWWQHGRPQLTSLIGHAVLAEIAARHNCTVPQVILSWHIAEGLIVYPKTSRPDRMAAHLAALEIELDAEDRYRIEAIDQPDGGRIGADPQEWNEIL
jgi:2,5-diketo-D-gluconate reductase A